MSFEWRTESDGTVLFCEGEMGHLACEELRTELLLAMDYQRELNIDLSGVTDAGSIFVQVLASSRKTANARELSVNLLNPSPAVESAMQRISVGQGA